MRSWVLGFAMLAVIGCGAKDAAPQGGSSTASKPDNGAHTKTIGDLIAHFKAAGVKGVRDDNSKTRVVFTVSKWPVTAVEKDWYIGEDFEAHIWRFEDEETPKKGLTLEAEAFRKKWDTQRYLAKMKEIDVSTGQPYKEPDERCRYYQNGPFVILVNEGPDNLVPAFQNFKSK